MSGCRLCLFSPFYHLILEIFRQFGIVSSILPFYLEELVTMISNTPRRVNSMYAIPHSWQYFIKFIILIIEEYKTNYYVGYTTQLATCIRFWMPNIKDNRSKYNIWNTTQLAKFIWFRIPVIEDSQINYYVGYTTQLSTYI